MEERERVRFRRRKGFGDAAYIRLSSFYGNAAAEFGRAAQAYKEDGKTKLLFDLRNDGGGSVSVMQGIAAYLMKDARSDTEPVMHAVYGNGREEIYLAGGDYYDEYFAGSEIYVAANRNTASASEALIGVMLSYDTIGYGNIFITELPNSTKPARTYGKGIMQTTFRNSLTGEAIKLTHRHHPLAGRGGHLYSRPRHYHRRRGNPYREGRNIRRLWRLRAGLDIVAGCGGVNGFQTISRTEMPRSI